MHLGGVNGQGARNAIPSGTNRISVHFFQFPQHPGRTHATESTIQIDPSWSDCYLANITPPHQSAEVNGQPQAMCRLRMLNKKPVRIRRMAGLEDAPGRARCSYPRSDIMFRRGLERAKGLREGMVQIGC